MKKIGLIFLAVFLGFILSSCEENMTNNYDSSYRVIFYNTDASKYISEIRYRESYYEDQWSNNQLYDTLFSGEQTHLDLYSSTYDFKIVMEDDQYYYTLYKDNVYIDYDIRFEICYDCKNNFQDKIEVRKK